MVERLYQGLSSRLGQGVLFWLSMVAIALAPNDGSVMYVLMELFNSPLEI